MAWRRVESLSSVLGQAAAVLILLSANQGECLQCYWCGPLAEQVHRSQRAQPCNDGDNQITACEPGYTHCAVVASSPPFAESRYCVKFYQDECYTLFCNTTRTYKMTCPCRGELCNGANTERELDAFAALSKTIAKTQNHRLNKRNAITSSYLKNSGKSKMNNLIDNDADENNSNNNNNEENDTNDTAVQTDPPPMNDNESNNDHSTSNNSDSNSTPEGKIETEKPTKGNVEANKETSNINIIETTPGTIKEEQMPETMKEEQVHETMKGENVPETTKEEDMPEIMKKVHMAATMKEKHIDVTMTITMKAVESTMKTDENSYMNNDLKPSFHMPTAEALQQNASPVVTTEKPVDHTMMETTTYMNTLSTPKNIKEITTKPSKSPRNSSGTSSYNIHILLTSLSINYTLFKVLKFTT